MSKPKPQFQPSNVLLVEVPPQCIALCEASGATPQAALRGRPPWSAACSTMPATAWFRWKVLPPKLQPGAGSACARFVFYI